MHLKPACFILSAFLMLAGLVLCGCARKADEAAGGGTNELSVFIDCAQGQYPQMEALEDPAVRTEIEKKLDIHLVLQRIETDHLDDIGRFDIFLFDQPVNIVELAEHHQILPLRFQSGSGENPFGKYKGSQYGYIFRNNTPKVYPKLLVLPDVLEERGIREIPFTPEAVETALTVLSEDYQAPIAVSGEPVSANFFPLMGLFGISPSEGNEFCLEDGSVSYDKISDRMQKYLSFIRELYLNHLLPEEMFVLSEYSTINMLNNHISVMAAFKSELFLQEAARVLQERGKRVALADIPLNPERYEINVMRRLTGTVGTRCADSDKAEQLLLLLDDYSGYFPAEKGVLQLEKYPLFSPDYKDEFPEIVRPESYDEAVLAYWYQKAETDRAVLMPVFDRIATDKNVDPGRFFREAKTEWLTSEYYSLGVLPDNSTILRIYDNMFHNYLSRN